MRRVVRRCPGVRLCPGCGLALERFSDPLEPGTCVPCLDCPALYVATVAGLERLELRALPPELCRAFEELVAYRWRERFARSPIREEILT